MENTITHLSAKGLYDYKLIRLAVEEGSQKAYTELFQRYYNTLYFKLLHMVHDADDAQGLTIETFGMAFNQLAEYVPTYAFSTWLFRIAHNTCVDFIRGKKNGNISIDAPLNKEQSNPMEAQMSTTTLNPEEKTIKKEKIKHLHAIVDTLKPRYKILVELYYFQELSYVEIAKRLEMPLGTVKGHLLRAKELLQKMLKNSQGGL